MGPEDAGQSGTPGVDALRAAPDGTVALSRYRLGERLGSGSRGVVFAALDLELERRVAIKFLRGGADRLDPVVGSDLWRADEGEDLDRLVVEAKMLAKVSHANVVCVFDVGRYEVPVGVSSAPPGVPTRGVFVVMELVDGVPLTEWIVQRRPTSEILEVFLDAGRGLAAAHDKGIVHRDFKPANVLIGPSLVKVMDFGFAQEMEADLGDTSVDAENTQPGLVVGTLAYMAPEQQRGEAVDERADQFAFCASLAEALSGDRPFRGRDERDLYAAKALMPFEALPRRVPVRVRNALRRGLHPDPAQRFESMAALLDAIRPERRRGRHRGTVLGLAAGLAVGVAFHALVVSKAPESEPSCGDASVATSIWDEQMRASVRRALATEPATMAVLDDYARRWTDQRRRACAEARPQVASCLDARAEEFRSVVESIVSLEVPHVRETLVVDAVSSLEPCGPESETPTEAVAAVRQHLSRGRNLLMVGDLEEAAGEARKSIEAAEAIGDPALQAEAHLQLGVVLEHGGDAAQARPHLQTAFQSASGGTDPAVAARAAALLVRLESLRHGDSTAARGWARLAQAELDQVPNELETRELLEANLGRAELLSGRPAAAIDHLRRALELRDDSEEQQWPVAEYLDDLGTALQDLGQPDEARAHFRQALELRRRELGPEHPQVADSLDHLSAFELSQGRAPRALELARESLSLRERVGGAEHDSVAISRVHLGRALDALGRHAEAIEHFDGALDRLRRQAPHHPLLASIEYFRGRAYERSGEALGAERSYREALETLGGPEHADRAGVTELRSALSRVEAGQSPTDKP